MNVVSLMAHQDDEMNCLGTMLKCRARGDRLFFITVTDGSKGFTQNPGISRAKAAAIRHAEMQALAKAAGARFINLKEPDEFLYDTPEVRMNIIEAIRRTKADLIFTHYRDDYNLDHTAVHALVRHCAMQSCLGVLPTASAPLKAHPAVFMTRPFGAIHFPATHYVDITEYQEAKTKLLMHHQSQETAMKQATGAGLRELCATAFPGGDVGCAYAECFLPMPGRGTIKPYSVLP
jgi:LmbE family N-acetylglucosaminyl deacetylase